MLIGKREAVRTDYDCICVLFEANFMAVRSPSVPGSELILFINDASPWKLIGACGRRREDTLTH